MGHKQAWGQVSGLKMQLRTQQGQVVHKPDLSQENESPVERQGKSSSPFACWKATITQPSYFSCAYGGGQKPSPPAPMGTSMLTLLDPGSTGFSFDSCCSVMPRRHLEEDPHGATAKAPSLDHNWTCSGWTWYPGPSESVNPVAVPLLPVKWEKPWEGR